MDDSEQRRIDAGNSIDLKWLRSVVVVVEEDVSYWPVASVHVTPTRSKRTRPSAGIRAEAHSCSTVRVS